jgi:diacylglycerol O-acyltransferase
VASAIKEQFESTANVLAALRKYSSVFMGRGGALSAPMYKMPHTSLNSNVGSARRFVAQSWEMDRIKSVAKALDATLNDIVLAMSAGALRTYLKSQNELPRKSLKAGAPVSLREEGDLESANAIGFIIADLATNVADPERRLRAIQRSMKAGKDLLGGLSPRESVLFAQLTQLPSLVPTLLGFADQLPSYNAVISNVPGPRQPLYWNGARLDGIYPVNIVLDGFALSITLVGYDDSLDFGIVACRKSVPGVQRLIDYLEDALKELEEVAGIGSRKKKARAKKKTQLTAKAQTKPKQKAKAKAKAKPKTTAKKKTGTRRRTPA